MPTFQHHHIVSFEETSLVGNVYFSNYVLWQGHCREVFLSLHAPGVIQGLEHGKVAFLTRSCSCEYEGDWGFSALEEVIIAMHLANFRGGRMTLDFTYYNAARPDQVVARGTQEVHCKVRRGEAWVAAPFPAELIRALLGFADEERLREALQQALEFLDADRPDAGDAQIAS
ncbi:MAG: enediyne biosynthesis thioesterase [Chlamydiales bacterium]|jgi:enediyne biosynthesis thioesterase